MNEVKKIISELSSRRKWRVTKDEEVATEGIGNNRALELADDLIDGNPDDIEDVLDVFQEVTSTLEMAQKFFELLSKLVTKAGGSPREMGVWLDHEDTRYGIAFGVYEDEEVKAEVESNLPRGWKSWRDNDDLIIEPDMT